MMVLINELGFYGGTNVMRKWELLGFYFIIIHTTFYKKKKNTINFISPGPIMYIFKKCRFQS